MPPRIPGLNISARKGVVERNLLETGISHAILRPAVLFGREDILINNIAWILRHFPVFFVLGRPAYRLQPIHGDMLYVDAPPAGTIRLTEWRKGHAATIGGIYTARALSSVPP
jgi:NADH dehydrogenase